MLGEVVRDQVLAFFFQGVMHSDSMAVLYSANGAYNMVETESSEWIDVLSTLK